MHPRLPTVALVVAIGVPMAFAPNLPAHGRPSVRRAATIDSEHRPAEVAISDYWKGMLFVTASGRRLAAPRLPHIGEFSISPDGHRIAYDAGIYSIDESRLSGSGKRRVVRGESPSWSPDGNQITYDNSNKSNGYEASIYTDRLGSRPVELVDNGDWLQTPVWSPDGVHIAYEQESPPGGIGRHSGIYVTDGKTQTLVQLDHRYRDVNFAPSWSPNGKQLAFVSNRHGAKYEYGRSKDVYIVNADGSHARRLTFDRHRDEDSPVWSPDGREIAYGVKSASGARAGVAVKPATGGRACLIYATWGGIDQLQWRPGYTARPERPKRCSMSLRPARPAKPVLACSGRAARNAVNRSSLSLPLRQVTHEPGHNYDFHHLCPDFTRDGTADLVVMFSGGVTGNTFHWAAFRRGPHDWHLVASTRGSYMTLRERHHNIVEKQPVSSYKGGWHFTGYHHYLYKWNGQRLVRTAHWFTHAKSTRPR
jgi:Tol biopolymer transport system component